jgi:hypothetical protein
VSKQRKAIERRHAAQHRRLVTMAQNLPDPKPVGQVVITIFENGSVSVKGFPPNHQQAIQILGAAQMAVADHFVRLAAQGQYPEKRNIVTPTTDQVLAVAGTGRG